MDVGFNNKNTFEHKQLKDVVFLVEATSNEQHNLWREYANDHYDLDGLDTEIPIPSILEQGYNSCTRQQLDEFIELRALADKVIERNRKIKESRKYRVDWIQDNRGFLIEIGQLNKAPICVSFFFAKIKGHRVGFYEVTSRVAHHGMVEDWLTEHFQLTHDGYTRWNHTNADNFHNCIRGLDTLDKEPRDTIYKK